MIKISTTALTKKTIEVTPGQNYFLSTNISNLLPPSTFVFILYQKEDRC